MLNAAIVGLGNWGQVLVNAVQARSEWICFAVGTTRTPSRAADFAARHGIELLQNLDAVLARDDVEAVVLATPHSQHLEQILAAVAAGKHVFCEKPLTLTAADAERAFGAANAAGVVLAVGHNRRFLPAYKMLSRLAANEIGDLRQIIGNFSWDPVRQGTSSWRHLDSESPAGGMTGLGIHVIDAMMGLGMHPNAVTVASRSRDVNGRADTVTALIENSGGSLAVLTTMNGPGRVWRIEVFGSAGRAIMDGEQRIVFAKSGVTEQCWTFPWCDIEHAALETFAFSVAGLEPYPVSEGEAVRGIRLFEAICNAVASAPRGQARTAVYARQSGERQ